MCSPCVCLGSVQYDFIVIISWREHAGKDGVNVFCFIPIVLAAHWVCFIGHDGAIAAGWSVGWCELVATAKSLMMSGICRRLRP